MKNSFRLIKYFHHLASFHYILHFVVDAVVCPVPVMLEPGNALTVKGCLSLSPHTVCACAPARAHVHTCVCVCSSDSMQSAVYLMVIQTCLFEAVNFE